MNIKILVATHKQYSMPQDSMYLPIQVGKETASVSLPHIGDNTGDNISAKNPYYCELTALYWAWKNLSADYIGLAHYRRHFCKQKPVPFCRNKFPYILSSTQVEPLLNQCSVLLPKPRNYWIETNYSHYVHAHPAETMELTKKILEQRFPACLPAWEQVMNRTSAHRFNMFIMRQDIFHGYCEWLFAILFDLEQQLDLSNDAYKRIFGYVSERLLDIYLETNHISYKELPVLFMEQEHWLKKGFAFLKRKLLH